MVVAVGSQDAGTLEDEVDLLLAVLVVIMLGVVLGAGRPLLDGQPEGTDTKARADPVVDAVVVLEVPKPLDRYVRHQLSFCSECHAAIASADSIASICSCGGTTCCHQSCRRQRRSTRRTGPSAATAIPQALGGAKDLGRPRARLAELEVVQRDDRRLATGTCPIWQRELVRQPARPSLRRFPNFDHCDALVGESRSRAAKPTWSPRVTGCSRSVGPMSQSSHSTSSASAWLGSTPRTRRTVR